MNISNSCESISSRTLFSSRIELRNCKKTLPSGKARGEMAASQTETVAVPGSSRGKRTNTDASSPIHDRKKMNLTPNGVTKKVKGTDISINIVPTSNEFGILTNNDKEVIITPQLNSKKVRIPPITIANSSKQTIATAMKTLKIDDFSVKPLKHGINLYCRNVDDFRRVKEELTKSENVKFYSHELESEKCFKVVLYNLQSTDQPELTDELKDRQLTPVRIRAIKPRRPRYENHVDFVLYFNKGETSLANLKKIEHLCHVKVDWAPFRNSRQGVTQCSRCMRPGHGEKNCRMSPRCEYCAGDHLSDGCPQYEEILRNLNDESNGGRYGILAKCCNCGKDGHFASDQNCESKLKYLERRQLHSSNNRTNKQRHVPNLNVANYPNLQNGVEQPQQRMKNAAGPTFSQVFQNHRGTNSNDLNLNNFSSNSNPNCNLDSNSQGQSRISYGELMDLMTEMNQIIPELLNSPRQVAVTKLMGIALKYMYPDDGSK